MRWLDSILERFRDTPCRVCGIRHGPLMTLNMRGRLTTEHIPREVIYTHYKRQLDAARDNSPRYVITAKGREMLRGR